MPHKKEWFSLSKIVLSGIATACFLIYAGLLLYNYQQVDASNRISELPQPLVNFIFCLAFAAAFIMLISRSYLEWRFAESLSIIDDATAAFRDAMTQLYDEVRIMYEKGDMAAADFEHVMQTFANMDQRVVKMLYAANTAIGGEVADITEKVHELKQAVMLLNRKTEKLEALRDEQTECVSKLRNDLQVGRKKRDVVIEEIEQLHAHATLILTNHDDIPSNITPLTQLPKRT